MNFETTYKKNKNKEKIERDRNKVRRIERINLIVRCARLNVNVTHRYAFISLSLWELSRYEDFILCSLHLALLR